MVMKMTNDEITSLVADLRDIVAKQSLEPKYSSCTESYRASCRVRNAADIIECLTKPLDQYSEEKATHVFEMWTPKSGALTHAFRALLWARIENL